MILRAVAVLVGLAAAGLMGFGLGLWISGPDWRGVFDASQDGGA